MPLDGHNLQLPFSLKLHDKSNPNSTWYISGSGEHKLCTVSGLYDQDGCHAHTLNIMPTVHFLHCIVFEYQKSDLLQKLQKRFTRHNLLTEQNEHAKVFQEQSNGTECIFSDFLHVYFMR